MHRTLLALIPPLALTLEGFSQSAALSAATRFSASDLSLGPAAIIVDPQQAGASGGAAGASSGSAGMGSGSISGAGQGASGSGAIGASSGATNAAPSGHTKFGTAGDVRFNFYGDFALDAHSDYLAGGQFGISWFFIDTLSLDVQLEQYGVWQSGPGAYAIGPALLFRWHFLSQDTWSIYVDGGCGCIWATNPVPSNGSRFNFTPRAGLGASFEVVENARLMTGARWFHISNANTYSPNPGRDSLELYAGLSIGF